MFMYMCMSMCVVFLVERSSLGNFSKFFDKGDKD